MTNVSPLTFTFLSLSLYFFFLCCSPIFSSCHDDIKLHMPCEFQGWKFYQFDLHLTLKLLKRTQPKLGLQTFHSYATC